MFMAAKTKAEKAAETAAAEEARRAALTQEERDAEDAATAKAAAEAAAKAAASRPAKVAVTVKFRDHKGEPTERTFSKAVHGDDFADLAEEFKTTNASKLITE
jgi:hypothetical protein